jgi:hypothetical protein
VKKSDIGFVCALPFAGFFDDFEFEDVCGFSIKGFLAVSFCLATAFSSQSLFKVF